MRCGSSLSLVPGPTCDRDPGALGTEVTVTLTALHGGLHRGPQRTQAMCQNESRHTVRRVSNGVGNRLALGPRSRYQKLNHDLDPSAWYKATDGFGPSRTDAQADQALCFPVLCGDTCMRV